VPAQLGTPATGDHDTTETFAMRKSLSRTALLTISMLTALMLGAAPASAETPPRPGCGYGDTNHAHQAAPGQDGEGLRPGKGTAMSPHTHTAPPGQAPDNGGDQTGPMRGCKDDPRG
jgi:hypothetical protein